MSLPENLENNARKRKRTPKKYCNTEKMSFYGAIRTENSDTDVDGYGEEYKKLHKYIKPRRMSIYAPDFRYGPNRRSYWQQELSDTDEDVEEEEKKVDRKYKKENGEEGSSEDERSSENSGDEHEENEDNEEDVEKAAREKKEKANVDNDDWEDVANLQKIEEIMEVKKKASVN
ncbi:Protein CBG27440 [Caenorhabditis briggsae]|uniref:Protein CBG27440 n=2 Tax=Caenorhabditis briggsae TaxID=6238 RepID=B6IK17_CAEBR|nr:Protein CBG27440 [Caenorhabditis briggsae]ULT79969.1 hypothetical protein L3Y34_010513 [Caenorhabditis briggsae]CAS00247.1 Protein CBG27440 [Caenorhabditis briggsae]